MVAFSEFWDQPDSLLISSDSQTFHFFHFSTFSQGTSVDSPFAVIDLMESLPSNVILCGRTGEETIEIRRSSDWQYKSLPDITLSAGNGAKQIKAVDDVGGFSIVGSSAVEIFDQTYTRQKILSPSLINIGGISITSVAALTGDDAHLLVGTQTSSKMLFIYNIQASKIVQNLDTEESNFELNISRIVPTNDNKIIVTAGKAGKLYIFK